MTQEELVLTLQEIRFISDLLKDNVEYKYLSFHLSCIETELNHQLTNFPDSFKIKES